MKQDEVITGLCVMANEVGKHQGHIHAHDCFCKQASNVMGSFQFSETVLQFIEDAVREKIAREKAPVSLGPNPRIKTLI